MDHLFDSLDGDGSGMLSQAEIKAAIRDLGEQSKEVRNAIEAMNRKAANLGKAARTAQVEWQAEQEEVQAAAAREAEQRRLEEQKRAAAEAEARAAKLEAAARKKAEAEAKRQEFNDKIAAKRSIGR